MIYRTVVEDTQIALEECVNNLLNEGYKLVGGASITTYKQEYTDGHTENKVLFCQTLKFNN